MEEHILTLEKAMELVKFREMYAIFRMDWHINTDVEYDALEYLVKNSSLIDLPNVTSLSDEKMELLKDFKGYLVLGFSPYRKSDR
jgi:hypothetical protein